MTNLHSVLKSRDITLAAKVHIVKAMVFLVLTYGCESWTIKKAECWRIDAFKLWCWKKLFKSPLDNKEIKSSILKEINSEYSLEGGMLKLKHQYFGHLMWRADSMEKTLMLQKRRAGGERNATRWDGWMASLTQLTWVWANSRRYWRTGKPGVLQSIGSQRVQMAEWLNNSSPSHWVAKSQTQLSNWAHMHPLGTHVCGSYLEVF